MNTMSVYEESRVGEVYGGTIPLLVLGTLLLIARIIARKISAAKLWWDDYTIVVALVSKAGPLGYDALPELTAVAT